MVFESEKADNNELKNYINLLKLDDDNNFEQSFINQINYLINQGEDKYFNFKS